MRVLVVTVVHTPLDARIHNRQIRALRDADVEVTYVAPWSDTDTDPGAAVVGVEIVDVPRARGRRRLRALRAARRELKRLGPDHDVVLLHDPELLLAVLGLRRLLPTVVLDVHENTPASLIDRSWVPRMARPLLVWLARVGERWAERHLRLLLAEEAYQRRFRRQHPFVPNVPAAPPSSLPPPGDARVVYLGRIARSRGAVEMFAAAEELLGEMRFELIGQVDPEVEPELRAAVAAGFVDWAGYVPNERALDRIPGALAGLSLIHPQPNHAQSLQTKVLEYMSRGVPVVSTDLPVTGPFVRTHQVGLTVQPGNVEEVVAALRRLKSDAEERREMAERGAALVANEMNWGLYGPRFVEHLRRFATEDH